MTADGKGSSFVGDDDFSTTVGDTHIPFRAGAVRKGRDDNSEMSGGEHALALFVTSRKVNPCHIHLRMSFQKMTETTHPKASQIRNRHKFRVGHHLFSFRDLQSNEIRFHLLALPTEHRGNHTMSKVMQMDRAKQS